MPLVVLTFFYYIPSHHCRRADREARPASTTPAFDQEGLYDRVFQRLTRCCSTSLWEAMVITMFCSSVSGVAHRRVYATIKFSLTRSSARVHVVGLI